MDQDNYNFDGSEQEVQKDNFQPDGNIIQPPTEDSSFRKSKLSYLTLFFLLIFWPLMSVSFVGDPAQMLRMLSVSPIVMVYLPTMVIQWLVFALVWVTVYREGTGLAGIGFARIRFIDFGWAIAFLFASNLILVLLSALLAYFGLEIPTELELILPTSMAEKIIWVMLAITAGVCEEAAFRGYLLTRLRIFGKTKNWIIPVIIASLSFGSGHAYQGLGGFLLITIYGAMFAFLFLRTKSLWPCVIAHTLQDMITGLFYSFFK